MDNPTRPPLDHAGDGNAMGAYTESYVYDDNAASNEPGLIENTSSATLSKMSDRLRERNEIGA